MDKLAEERNILKLAMPLLEKLYGNFEVDQTQQDKPDAAIILRPPASENHPDKKNQKIGIEITAVDKPGDQQYLNDEKISRGLTSEQIERFLKDGHYSTQPKKKLSIAFANTYISEGVLKKQDKYVSYIQSGNYDEVIILAFSNYLYMDYPKFSEYHTPWTSFLLSEQKFPFDKVIFVCKKTGKSAVIYDKNLPQLDQPQKDQDSEAGIDVAHSSLLPMEKKVNLSGLFDKEPLIPRSRAKKSKGKKN